MPNKDCEYTAYLPETLRTMTTSGILLVAA